MVCGLWFMVYGHGHAYDAKKAIYPVVYVGHLRVGSFFYLSICLYCIFLFLYLYLLRGSFRPLACLALEGV